MLFGMVTPLLAAATWDEVVPFIAMVSVPLCSVIGILYKRNNSLQDKMLEQAERIIPLATNLASAVTELSGLVDKIQGRSLTQQQVDRFNRNLERFVRVARQKEE